VAVGPKLVILNDHGYVLDVGTTKHIYLCKSLVMIGYKCNVDANKEALFTSGLFKTLNLKPNGVDKKILNVTSKTSTRLK
jgi:hypothetical protein